MEDRGLVQDGDEDGPDDEVGDHVCICQYHARHWTSHINLQRTHLRRLVRQRLYEIFCLTPSYELYTSILSISDNSSIARIDLCAVLADIADSSSDTLAAALDIHASEGEAGLVSALLNEHSYLLRPRDFPALQTAALVLSYSPAHLPRATQLLETELIDAIHAVRAAIHMSFSRILEPAQQADLTRILKLSPGSTARIDGIENWLDEVATPSTVTVAGAFVALMMGMPPPGGMVDHDVEEAEFLDVLDGDKGRDPDLDELREEWRPKLKERFDAWYNVGMAIKGGNAIMTRVYLKVIETMPYLKGTDVVEEMAMRLVLSICVAHCLLLNLCRLSERPSKHHVADALEALSAWAKQQRRKVAARAGKSRRTDAHQWPVQSSSQSPISQRSSSAHPPPHFGGIDDVD